ncbi:Fc.00g053520.m01.CDS01 [Cosmosporella sp. VM-42]
MLAAHRDQENLVHSRQVTSKQQAKTPGARFPKTPSRYPQRDENAPTAFAGKTGLDGARKFGGDKTVMKGTQQAFTTPMGQTRAPLGNKTTNAKARNVQATGGKGMVKEIKRTQTKPTTTQKPKHRSADLAPIDFKDGTKLRVHDKEEEPEYAPPRPKDLPYESDVLPRGMLTFEGLKRENVLKGYYQHFCNPVDDKGVSKEDREFEQTMKKVMAKAEERNQKVLDELSWNIADLDI